jgi:hypothetical protein
MWFSLNDGVYFDPRLGVAKKIMPLARIRTGLNPIVKKDRPLLFISLNCDLHWAQIRPIQSAGLI